jgi:hypothetical protein
MSGRLLLLAGALGGAVISAAHAQETVLWRNVGEWQVRVDRSVDYGCFIIGSYTRGTVIRIGIDQQNRNGYVLVGNDGWRSLVAGNQYDLTLRFDNDAPWRGRAKARTIGSGNTLFLYLSFDRPQFLVDFARRMNLTIFYDGQVVTQLPLNGTRAATEELFLCQRAADAARDNSRPARDPFSSGGAPPPRQQDPFSSGGSGGRRPDQVTPPPQPGQTGRQQI